MYSVQSDNNELIQMRKILFSSLRKQPSFLAPSPSDETPFGQGAKKDGCFRRLTFLPLFSMVTFDISVF